MKDLLYRLFEHQYMDRSEAQQVLAGIAAGKYNPEQVSALITVFLMRSISVEELAGFRDALLEMRRPADLSDYGPIDIVGTGGDGKNTFNISTAASFVVAGAGYNVVKHGNYGATSVSGASNVIERHGVRFTDDPDRLRASLDACRIAYLHAPLFNPAMKAVAPIRRNLAVRTFFNLLGPLVNPALPKYQLLGVYNLSLFRLYNYAYQSGGTRFGVVYSMDGYDEISLTSEFKVATPEKEQVFTPEQIGFGRCRPEELSGGDTPEEAARIFDSVLDNTAMAARRDCVVANAAFAIRVICPEKEVAECLAEAPCSMRRALAESETGVIAEFKRRSPSKGWLCRDAAIGAVVPAYEAGGASACSVLTDGEFFGGTLEDLKQARRLVRLPLLRKDFIVDEYQLYQARGRGLRERFACRDALHGRTLRPRVAPASWRRVARSVRGASAARLPDHQGDPRRVGRRPRGGPGLRRLRRLPAVRHPLRRLRRFGTTLRLVGARRLCGPCSVSAQRRNRRGVRRSGPGIRPSPFRGRGSQQRIRNGPGGEGRRKTRKIHFKNPITMNRINQLFASGRRDILSIYFCAGYPDPENTAEVIRALENNGVGMVEIGIPFSDPMADGPVIQHAAQQALRGGMSLRKLFAQLADIRPGVQIPLLLMGYLNPVMQYGFENFCRSCRDCGIDGCIIPDLPFDDYLVDFKPVADRYGVKVVMLITPETSEERIRQIDDHTDGFIYMVSSASTTGAQSAFDERKQAYFRRIDALGLRNPRMVGFGISNRATFRAAADNAAGCIVGSRFVTLQGETPGPEEAVRQLLEELKR